MAELWGIIRNIAEVLGMVFVPMIGWMLMTLINHSKKIIILEARVNETILTRLTSLETKFEKMDSKVDEVSQGVRENRLIVEQQSTKFDLILSEIKNLKKS